MTDIELHPDRLFPTDPSVRSIARRLYDEVAGLPIISPHGHVDPAILAEDQPFGDPANLLVVPDHYVTRLLHAHGVSFDSLGVPPGAPRGDASPREIWRTFCSHWWAFRGTPSRYWLEAELVDVFGVHLRPSADTADELFDQLSERLAAPEFRPRALYERFGIEVLATTDDPTDDLAAHRKLADDAAWKGRVVPTFRPDPYLEPARPDWPARVARLGEVTGEDTTGYAGYVAALEQRRAYFKRNGATATDHGHADAGSEPLEPAEASRIYAAALTGAATPEEATAFRRHMFTEMARMASEDGLVMQVHPGVLRDHHTGTFDRYGRDVGGDIPMTTEYTRSLRPLLERYGTHPNFRMVLFTVDEDVFSREIAPLAGFYPSVFVGAPWWFIDTPDAIRRFREAVTDTVGFHKTAGFVDDTRAYCSIPVRHDMARRLDCGFLARLVAEHRLPEDEAADTAADLAYRLPASTFRVA
ncbi:glucuronate isomerase [Actinopolymorpha singaporensis]|uniref:Uronate isomerase n=1 Tax=Actinopolymorpha singaporensis TaxID=117157 RepID=A0A1H1W613_9ACTN|nr:glucuronate isomerase [Actinopolymorpha singaporensis]SDS92758.1 glucuronate isomerase [Actinopolymorpha singaporensis]